MASTILPDYPSPKTTPTDLQRAQNTPLLKSHRRENLVLVESFDAFLGSQGRSPHTRRAYKRVCLDFTDFIRTMSLRDVDGRVQIREYLAYLVDHGASPQTIARETCALRTFFNFLGRIEVVERSPLRLIRTRRLPERLPRALTEQEVERLIEAALTPRDSALLELLYATGVRREELCAIKLAEINWSESERSILIHGKGSKERVVYYGRYANRAMQDYLESAGRSPMSDGHLFPGRNGQPLSGERVYSIVRATAVRAGLGKVGVHSLRVAFGTTMLNRGASLRCIQLLFGHSSIKTTARYLRLTTADLRRVLQRAHPRWEKETA